MRPWKINDLVETRTAYGEGLLALGRENPNVIVLDSDLQRSNKTFDFGEKFPDRFFDMGIAEADMISTAAGMASMGYSVFATSFAMFLPGRCYDQIRLMVAYAKSDVKLAGVSAGLTQGPDGASHQSFDDVGLMRQLPNMTVIVPADAEESFQAVKNAAQLIGPVYLRFGRYPTPVLYPESYKFEIGKASVLRFGEDITLYANGIMVAIALNVAEKLKTEGVETTVINVSTVKPLDTETIIQHAQGKKKVFTLEEHSVLNGLGSAVAEALCDCGREDIPSMHRIGMSDCFGQSANANELLDYYGLSENAVTSRLLKILSNKGVIISH